MDRDLPVLDPLGVFDVGQLPARSQASNVQRRQLFVWHGREEHNHVIATADSALSLRQRHAHAGHHACSNQEPWSHRYRVKLACCMEGLP